MTPDAHERPDNAGSRRLSAEARHREILAALDLDGRVEVGELAARFGASEETIRRDLRTLEQESKLIRAHGGAVRVQPVHLPVPERGDRALIERVLAEIPREGAVYLDGGRLAEQLVALLPEDRSLDLITPSLDVAIAASTHPAVAVLSLGGQADADGILSGEWARALLETLRPDTAIFFASGCTDAGELTARPADAALRALALRRSRRSVLVLEEGATDAAHYAVYARLGEVDVVIAGESTAQRLTTPLESARTLIVAGAA
ncbi:DeoR/GlpR family DNA-binding transcription regulator [Microbacterium sp. EF45047]|uniref:DeoR/GlpR family DNA-binding transcription regulator n=1 Tax=Microbacterium sp. EF45047 TaxID=2809708 RepID=UPI00234AA51E|nr:DeoR/GlpR family DNA-binding transcription regulator [Microbacterium sp. EF45047]WCM55940.1 DeoR/GlpR transcriptional regulator [Microbacterium sp. EF45047]